MHTSVNALLLLTYMTTCYASLSMKAVYKLKQMGFEEPDVLDALRVCNNNESAAVSVYNYTLFVSINFSESLKFANLNICECSSLWDLLTICIGSHTYLSTI